MYANLIKEYEIRLAQLQHEQQTLISNINAYNGAIEELKRLITVLTAKEIEQNEGYQT